MWEQIIYEHKWIYIFVFERSWSDIDTPLLSSGKVVAMQNFTTVTEWQRAG